MRLWKTVNVLVTSNFISERFNVDILRFITAGSVDDGKSTLIGRLLFDSNSILKDQLNLLKLGSKNKARGEIDLALLTDGLRAEREQSITIDVAYKYFATSKRKFVVVDAPGHTQYTRNFITGASNAQLIIILIDAKHGITEQTRRHSIIASLLGIKHIVVAVNKMDQVEFDEERFNQIVTEYKAIAAELGLTSVEYIPLSALNGDNIAQPSTNMQWYHGPALLQFLEDVVITNSPDFEKHRFQVQYVLRSPIKAAEDVRRYAGKIVSGIYRRGDAVKVLPSGRTTTIKDLEIYGQKVSEAFAPQNVSIILEDEIDISRGDSIVAANSEIKLGTKWESWLCWIDEKPLVPLNQYLLQHGTNLVRIKVNDIIEQLNIENLQKEASVGEVKLNDIVKIHFKTAGMLIADPHTESSTNGFAILIDETSNSTVACLLLNRVIE